jgi:predicted DNA-binding protein
MKRTNFYYPEEMLARLKAASQQLGIPVSEIIRRAIDAFLSRMKK